jgi:hypothetical protein
MRAFQLPLLGSKVMPCRDLSSLSPRSYSNSTHNTVQLSGVSVMRQVPVPTAETRSRAPPASTAHVLQKCLQCCQLTMQSCCSMYLQHGQHVGQQTGCRLLVSAVPVSCCSGYSTYKQVECLNTIQYGQIVCCACSVALLGCPG